MAGMERRSGEIVPVGERKALVLKGSEVLPVTQKDLREPSEIYLGSEIFQGEYGVSSFAIVIPHPKPRPFYYLAGEGPSGGYGDINDPDNQEDIDQSFDGDLKRASHYYSTEKGFAVARLVAAPVRVVEKLHTDRFLGPAIVDKCCLDGTIPGDFDEELGLSVVDSIGWDKSDEVEKIEERILKGLADKSGEPFKGLRAYPSWHSYHLYGEVMDQVQKGCRQTVVNFDELLSMLARDLPKLHDFRSGTTLPQPPDSPIRGEIQR